MALLESCVCCSLLVASGITAVYALVAYIIAFTVELWWILEAEVTLPAPSYVLCAGYFFVFVFSAFLLHGLTVKRTVYLLGWLFTVATFTFPEAGLVLFMSLQHWKLRSLNGLTELVYWACRFLCNIGGLVCVQSLYSAWKEEKLVLRRLQDLNMTSIITDATSGRSSSASNGHLKNGVGRQNPGFMASTVRLNKSAPALPRLRRSLSSASLLYLSQGPLFGGSLPADNFPERLTPLNNLQYAFFGGGDGVGTGSEFNASTFDGFVAGSAALGGRSSLGISRTQSLGDLRAAPGGHRLTNLWAEPPSRPLSADRLTTSSLDRRYMRRAGSEERLGGARVYRLRDGRVLVPADWGQLPGSRRSLAESDDMHKYRDVAL